MVNLNAEAIPGKKWRVISELAKQDQDNCKKLITILHKETGIGLTLLPKALNLTDKAISTILVMYLTDKKTPRYFKSTQKRKVIEFIHANPNLKETLETKYSDVLTFFLEYADQDLWKKDRKNAKLTNEVAVAFTAHESSSDNKDVA